MKMQLGVDNSLLQPDSAGDDNSKITSSLFMLYTTWYDNFFYGNLGKCCMVNIESTYSTAPTA